MVPRAHMVIQALKGKKEMMEELEESDYLVIIA